MVPDLSDVIISRMRLILSTTALVVYLGEMPGEVLYPSLTLALLSTYVGFSAIFCSKRIGLNRRSGIAKNRHWIDVFWFSFIIATTDPYGSVLFPFFLFPILSASFQEGFRKGMQVTVAATAIYLAAAVVIPLFTVLSFELERPALRAGFLLVFGYFIAHWGDTERATKLKLALMRDVSKVSNPRFGVEQTIGFVLEKIRQHFNAACCVLIQHDSRTGTFTMQESSSAKPACARAAKTLPPSLGELLIQSGDFDAGAYFCAPKHGLQSYFTSAKGCLRNSQSLEWQTGITEEMAAIADALSANGYLSARVLSKRKQGRVYVCTGAIRDPIGSASFLLQVVQYAFSTIDNIEILDRLATDAAYQERRKISRDLHDTTIQPYIGLQLGLQALRERDADQATLKREIEKLAKMTSDVVADLRNCVNRISKTEQSAIDNIHAALQRTARQFKEFYGIEIALFTAPHLRLNDRLAAEILQIVNEGLSNIRKHTQSRYGRVQFREDTSVFSICIENDQTEPLAAPFVPRSITERVQALGGRVWVDISSAQKTVLSIDIPK